MSISACYITKNAGEFLDYSIRSIKDFADKIIVIDDFSTDNTVEIAESHGAIVKQIKCDGDKLRQRNEYLKYADTDWILVVDDDEVYKPEHLEKLKLAMQEEDVVSIRYPLMHFWKDPTKIIKGHMWDQPLERCFKNLGGLQYTIHHMVSDRCNRYINSHYYHNKIKFRDDIKIFHYSYMKNSESIRTKIRYYMLRDNPNCNESNVEEWVNKHPYFSNNFGQPRYGDKGLYVAGSWDGEHEKIEDYTDTHPKIMYRHPIIYQNYLANANEYMNNHWQFHNHLDHKRHQNRLKLTASNCIGKTLEVGCANGFSTNTMQEANSNATFEGVEPTDWGYEQAVKNYPNIKFYKELGECLPFEDNSYDTVLLSEIIEHVQIPRALVDEAWRVAKKKVIITTPTQMHPDPDHKRFYSIIDMEKFLEPYGTAKFSGLTEKGDAVEKADDIYFQIAWVNK